MSIKIFSGIRPSGKLHLGNYLGAIKNWLALSEIEGIDQAIFAVVDYHGITTPYDPKTYQQQIMDVILDYLAAGLDPKKSLFIRQSHVPQHTEFAWLLGTIIPVGWLDRLPTYKEKLKQMENVGTDESERSKSYQNNLGLLAYPVLMASDILLYKSNLVPVGEDQLIHIDITNEITKKFNSLFGKTFEPVKAHLNVGARIMSLQDPKRKMSKTGDDGIALNDDPDTIRTKIKRAVTDSGKEIKFNIAEKPAISNLLAIYHLLSGKEIKEIEKNYTGKSYVEFKTDLAEAIVNFLKPFQERRKEFADNPAEVERILTSSEEKARTLADKTLNEVKRSMGLE